MTNNWHLAFVNPLEEPEETKVPHDFALQQVEKYEIIFEREKQSILDTIQDLTQRARNIQETFKEDPDRISLSSTDDSRRKVKHAILELGSVLSQLDAVYMNLYGEVIPKYWYWVNIIESGFTDKR